MKAHIFGFAVLFGLITGVMAEEATKPLVSLTVKRQVLGTEDNDRGARSELREKKMTLRVEIQNISGTSLEGAELSGDVLLNRSIEGNERTVKESLKSLKLPPLKPNENLTVELGSFTLSAIKWKARTYEETLEEWKVVCKKGETTIGGNISDEKYETLVKEMEDRAEKDKKEAAAKKGDPENPNRKGKFRRLRD